MRGTGSIAKREVEGTLVVAGDAVFVGEGACPIHLE